MLCALYSDVTVIDAGVPIGDAINRGDIVIEYSTTRRSVPITDIIKVITVRRRIIDHEYVITAAVDATTAEVVDCVEAVARGILDFTDPAGEFVDLRTGARMPLHDAVESEWVSTVPSHTTQLDSVHRLY